MSQHPEPVGGRMLTARTVPLFILAAAGIGVLVWRFAVGLGPTTGLNDGYPWGLWIALDVVVGTAVACGGYAVALLLYVLNKGRLHPLMRPALLASLLGYGLAGLAVVVDLGRYWAVYNFALPNTWNLNSVLLEVALCIMTYLVVVALELAPALLEHEATKATKPARVARVVLRWLERAMPFILALGVLLPTMHQSSLGGLMMIAVSKLDPLWHTGLLPLLFLLSCLGMGYAAVIGESLISNRAFVRPDETPLLARLVVPILVVQLAFVAVRLIDVAVAGKLPLIADSSLGVLFLVENALFLAPVVLLATPASRLNPARLFGASMLFLAAGALYRFDTFLVAYDPGPGWTYFPTVPEVLVSAGMIAAEILIFVWVVRRFPILSAGGPPRPVAASPAAS